MQTICYLAENVLRNTGLTERRVDFQGSAPPVHRRTGLCSFFSFSVLYSFLFRLWVVCPIAIRLFLFDPGRADANLRTTASAVPIGVRRHNHNSDNMVGTNASGSERSQDNGNGSTSRQRTANTPASPRNLHNYELHLIDESYDEAADPDYTLGNITGVSISDIDIEDEEDNELSIDELEEEKEDIVIDLQDSDTDMDSNSTTTTPVTEKGKAQIFGASADQNNSQSSVSLPIHAKFRSFVHKNEIPRKLFHVSIGFVTLYLHCHGYKTANTWRPVSMAVSCIFLLDLIRFNWPYFNKLYCSTVGFLMREKEVNSINGVIWFQLGSVITFMSQSQDVSVMSVLLLSWSDTAASTIGRQFGHASPKLARGKSLIGSVAAFITGIIACYVFYGVITPRYPQYSQGFEYDPSTNMLNLHTLALLSGFIAAVSEGIDIAGLDDNLTIPVLSGFFLSGVIKLGKSN